jgi:hypothetical protein
MNFADEAFIHRTAKDLDVEPREVYRSLEKPAAMTSLALSALSAGTGGAIALALSGLSAGSDVLQIAKGIGDVAGGDSDAVGDIASGFCGFTTLGPVCDAIDVAKEYSGD